MGQDLTDQYLLWYNINEYGSIDNYNYDNRNYSFENNLGINTYDWGGTAFANWGNVI